MTRTGGDAGAHGGEAPPVELEASLVVVGSDAAATLRRVAGRNVLAGRRLGSPRRLRLRDVYLDLPGELLLRAGRAFRLRRGDGPPTLTLKGGDRPGEGPGVEREEREAPWGPEAEALLRRVAAAGEAGDVDAAAVAEAAREEREPLPALAAAGFRVLQDRTTRRIVRPILEDGRAVGELAVDEVRFDAGGRDCVHREIEVEAATAGPAGRRLLGEAVGDLRDALGPGVRPWDHSKLATGRALVALLVDADQRPAWLAPDGSIGPEGYERVEALLEAYETRR